MNLTAIKKASLVSKKLSKDYNKIYLQINNLQVTLYRSSCLLKFYRIVGILKGVLKNITNFTGKYLCRVWWERKSLVLYIRPAPLYKRDSCTQLFSGKFRRIFENNLFVEQPWESASNFLFDIFKLNKYMKVRFIYTFSYRKS